MEPQHTFVFLTPREQLVGFRAVAGPDGNYVVHRWDFHVLFRPDFLLGDVDRTKRYLVESRGQLLMAVRNVYNEGLGTTTVWLSPLMNTGDGNKVWGDNVVLNGRVLFLGPGCSRCFELAPNAFRDDANNDAKIYFFDERTSVPTAAATDTGRFSQKDLKTEPWPPAPGPPRSDVPPTWWLH
jgi:hypothetical protein